MMPTYLAIIKKSRVLIFLMFILIAYFMKCISLDTKFKLFIKYNLYYIIYFNIIFIKNSDF